MSEWMMDAIDWLIDSAGPIIVIVLVAFIVVGLAVATYYDEKDWSAFAVAHHCHVIRESSGQTIITSDGKTAYISGTKTWACDDGKEYTR